MRRTSQPRSVRSNENKRLPALPYPFDIVLDLHSANWRPVAPCPTLVAALVSACHMQAVLLAGGTTGAHRRRLSGQSQTVSCQDRADTGCGAVQVRLFENC